MKSKRNSASIVWDDEFGIQYRICRLDYTEWESGRFEYVFTPDYRVMDMLPMARVGGIPGLDLDLRLEKYVRKNMEPVFMTERSPSRNRVDVWELMKSEGLDHYDRLEWLIRTDLRYAGDDLYVIRYEEPGEFRFEEGFRKDAFSSAKSILSALGTGGSVSISGKKLDGASASEVGRTLRFLLESDRRVNPERPEIGKVGRKKKGLDEATLYWARDNIRNGLFTAEEISEQLGVSKSTLYRRMRENGWKS